MCDNLFLKALNGELSFPEVVFLADMIDEVMLPPELVEPSDSTLSQERLLEVVWDRLR